MWSIDQDLSPQILVSMFAFCSNYMRTFCVHMEERCESASLQLLKDHKLNDEVATADQVQSLALRVEVFHNKELSKTDQ